MAAHRVVIVGGGFGGLYAARSLRRAPVDVTIVDQRNFHLFQPLLYQVATGGLSPANIAAPLRALVARQPNTRVVLAEVIGVDVHARQVVLRDGALPYDTLILATGARHAYFGHDEWEALAPGLKAIEDATEIRSRVLVAFEEAERETDPDRQRALLTFVVVGGGPTGVELAGTICELARQTLRHNFRAVDPARAQVLLVEGGPRILAAFSPKLSASAERQLRQLGATVRTSAVVTELGPGVVVVKTTAGEERIRAATVVWAAGVESSPLGRVIGERTGAALDRAGRVIVGADCSVPGHPEIFVVGDLAHFAHPEGAAPLPGLAPVAMQQGEYVAHSIVARLEGRRLPPFRYRDRGTMATIGRKAAVARIGSLEFSGFLAWMAWLFIHLMYLVQFQNRLLVLMQWMWNYVTRNRSARLITGHFGDAAPAVARPPATPPSNRAAGGTAP